MDRKLREFLGLIDCDPGEIKDIPPERLLKTDELKAECTHINPEARRDSLGEMQLYFGKHKGTRLKDVPLSYLEWVLTVKPTSNSFHKFQRKVREFLGRDNGGGSR